MTTEEKIQSFFVFDVESIGLHGEGFAVGGGVYSTDGTINREFHFACSKRKCLGNADDFSWVLENIPSEFQTHLSAKEMRNDFWELWKIAKSEGSIMAADCLWPVEANFLSACVADDPITRHWEGPYPFYEIANYLLAAGFDPLADYERLHKELPKHNPLADARQSARLLIKALSILKSPRQ